MRSSIIYGLAQQLNIEPGVERTAIKVDEDHLR